MMENNYECLVCGEDLKENKDGKISSKKTGEEISVYVCKECDQAFGLTKDGLSFAPYDSNMQPIKHECKVCGTVEHFHQKVVFILDEPPRMGTYCFDCALEFLRNWVRKTNPEAVNNVTHENVQEVSQLHEVSEFNRLAQDPEEVKKWQSDPSIKKLREDIREGAKNDSSCVEGSE